VKYDLYSELSQSEIFSRTFDVIIDRPIGYHHVKGSKSFTYPINYGEIPGLLGGDGELQDVYVLGVTEPIETFRGRIIAIIHRHNDVEDKWVTCPEGMTFTKAEIEAAVNFQEQYYSSVTILPDETEEA